MKSHTTSIAQKSVLGIPTSIWIRFYHIMPILGAVVLVYGTLSFPIAVVEYTPPIVGDSPSLVITSMGIAQDNPAIFSLVSFHSGFGIFVLIGLIVLILFSVTGAISLNIWIELSVIFLAVLLVILDQINTNIMTSIILSPAATNLTVRTLFNVKLAPYLDIITFTFGIITFSYQMRKSARQTELTTSANIPT